MIQIKSYVAEQNQVKITMNITMAVFEWKDVLEDLAHKNTPGRVLYDEIRAMLEKVQVQVSATREFGAPQGGN